LLSSLLIAFDLTNTAEEVAPKRKEV